MNRRRFVAALVGTALAPRVAAQPAREREHDFDVMWREIQQGYAYLDPVRRRAWLETRDRLRQAAMRARGDAASIAVMQAAVERLRDDSVTISHPALASRRIPYDLDIWPRWRDGAAIVEAVRTFSDADIAGVHPGHRIVAIDGMPVERAIRTRLGGAPGGDAEAQWALRRLLVDPRTGALRMETVEGGARKILEIDRGGGGDGNTPPVMGRRMGDERDIGYVRVRMGADERIAPHFEGALGHMSGTRALIVDLRESAGPAPRATTLSILSRFARSSSPWQVRRAGAARIADSVAAAANTAYAAPLVVLVDRWTAGEGEALAAGLAALADARIVGTPTAGLHGEPRERVLPASGAVLRYPAEQTFLVTGKPRDVLEPDVAVDPAAPSGGPGDPILYQALKLLERR